MENGFRVKFCQFIQAGWRIYAWLELINIASGNGLSPVPQKVITHANVNICTYTLQNKIPTKFESIYNSIRSEKWTWKCCLQNGGHFVSHTVD